MHVVMFAARDGVVVATEKKVPSILVDETSFERMVMLSENIGVIYSGMGPDFRVLVRKCQKHAVEYHLEYKVRPEATVQAAGMTPVCTPSRTHCGWGASLIVAPVATVLFQERIPVLQLVRAVASIMQEFTQSGGVRPFGVSLLIAGFDDDGPQLYQVRHALRGVVWR
jgi:20S proteasome subunit alpha 2